MLVVSQILVKRYQRIITLHDIIEFFDVNNIMRIILMQCIDNMCPAADNVASYLFCKIEAPLKT